jgi:hypothetical protein
MISPTCKTNAEIVHISKQLWQPMVVRRTSLNWLVLPTPTIVDILQNGPNSMHYPTDFCSPPQMNPKRWLSANYLYRLPHCRIGIPMLSCSLGGYPYGTNGQFISTDQCFSLVSWIRNLYHPQLVSWIRNLYHPQSKADNGSHSMPRPSVYLLWITDPNTLSVMTLA